MSILCVPLADLLAQFSNKCRVLCCKVGSLVWVDYHIVELRIWCVAFQIWSSKPISAVLSLAIVVEILYKGSNNLQLYRRFLLFRGESRPFGVWQYAPHCETPTQKIQISARGSGSRTRNYYDSMRDVEWKWVWIELWWCSLKSTWNFDKNFWGIFWVKNRDFWGFLTGFEIRLIASKWIKNIRSAMCTPYIIFLFSDSGGIRTHDPQLRRLLLYPTELRNHHIESRRTFASQN